MKRKSERKEEMKMGKKEGRKAGSIIFFIGNYYDLIALLPFAFQDCVYRSIMVIHQLRRCFFALLYN